MTAEQIWAAGAAALREQLADATWNTWFQGLEPIGFEGDVLTLGVPSTLAYERIRTSYGELLTAALREGCGREVRVELAIITQARTAEPLPPAFVEPLSPIPPLSPPAVAPSAPAPLPDPAELSSWWSGKLNPRYTFDQFVIGASNRFAHAAALTVAEAPARSYNPLFIYGDAGLGKTHLLHAVGHHVNDVFGAKRVRYVTTEMFMNEFVEAIRAKSMPGFKRRYRELDLLLIDDIQFLERTQELQEEFFHTFNQLHSDGGQIVISSDRSPKSMGTLEDRLRSRFEWGLSIDVQPPEFETRLAILRKKAEAEHFEDIPGDVLAFIATNITDNVRELEGALIRVAAFGNLNRNTSLSEEVARHVLADLLPPSKPRIITPDLILDETAKMFGWTVEDLCGKAGAGHSSPPGRSGCMSSGS